MKDIILALVAGGLVGAIFGKVGLPIPAPANVAGLMGIAGIMLGYIASTKFF
ncbi:XapX domain-containing protein [Anaerobranca californiensis DSM 14826]|jgi:XapX domain-containing protein|uniref:XapX domain-containing protein n=1 Tax=Anaerobranca californiensis DSM 14826 TaxID=1120989 RepID=A0A1M6M7A3_9FIRM|nr:XapX domain-containing protein [Anaerobranca californiensis]SHJ79337.1 XapX domain-containing protein [Anaerobranca californiensis DSM 14826]